MAANTTSPLAVRRCYQPLDMVSDALLEVLEALLMGTLSEAPTPQDSAPVSTCFQAPNE